MGNLTAQSAPFIGSSADSLTCHREQAAATAFSILLFTETWALCGFFLKEKAALHDFAIPTGKSKTL